jgi:hypothetical protein
MAAGLTMRHELFDAFRDAFGCAAREMLTAEHLVPRLRLDAEVRLDEVRMPMLKEHDGLNPFGMENRQPIFFCARSDVRRSAARDERQALRDQSPPIAIRGAAQCGGMPWIFRCQILRGTWLSRSAGTSGMETCRSNWKSLTSARRSDCSQA